MDTSIKLQELFGDRLLKNADISPLTTLKMPASAEYFVRVESDEDWKKMGTLISQLDIPLTVLGGGSNIAIITNQVKGLVIKNATMYTRIIKETDTCVDIEVSSGYPMGKLVKEMGEAGWQGFEYHLGLPGTLGGAIVMNSKWMKPVSFVSDTLTSASILTREGHIKTVGREYFAFSYGFSNLQKTGEILISAVFHLAKEDPEILKQRSQEALNYRKQTQPFGVHTAGCFFKNISDNEKESHNLQSKSAGFLIDQVGMKGVREGGFTVSDIHANFIINDGTGTREELQTLLAKIKGRVYDKWGLELKEEVQKL